MSSGACIAALAAAIPEFIGGSADLAPSNNSTIKGAEAIAGAPLANKENAKADSVLPGRMNSGIAAASAAMQLSGRRA